MTGDEKRDRRQAKHELADQFRRLAIRRLGLYSTGPQIRAAVSEVTRSPSRKPRTVAPTPATTPQNSCPRTTGTLTGQLCVLWY